MSPEFTTGESEGIHISALGTGAAALNNERASAGYVVHIDGQPKLLVDAGGGAASRISDARIDLTMVDAVFFGHLHIDHTADFPAIVKAAYQQNRGKRPLKIHGPTGTEDYPGTETWVSRLFDEEKGAYNYLSDFVKQYTDGELTLDVTEIDATVREENEVMTVYESEGVTVEAIPAIHGQIPTLAYRVTYEGTSVTFTGDYASETENIPRIADGTDILVHNRILEEGTDPDEPKAELHSSAEKCGSNAQTADAGMLVLSHISREDPGDLDAELQTIRTEYDGTVVVIRDLIDIYPDGTVIDTGDNSRSGREGADKTNDTGDNEVVVIDDE